MSHESPKLQGLSSSKSLFHQSTHAISTHLSGKMTCSVAQQTFTMMVPGGLTVLNGTWRHSRT